MKASYANQDFEWAQTIANILTREDRAAGRPSPAVGYSVANIAYARKAIAQDGGRHDTTLDDVTAVARSYRDGVK